MATPAPDYDADGVWLTEEELENLVVTPRGVWVVERTRWLKAQLAALVTGRQEEAVVEAVAFAVAVQESRWFEEGADLPPQAPETL